MRLLKKIITVVPFTLTMIFFSCGKAELSGTFIPKEKNRVASVEFKDGNARFTDSFLGIKQGCMEFSVKGRLVCIKHPVTGILIFKIIDSDTLMCEMPGMYGFYTRLKK